MSTQSAKAAKSLLAASSVSEASHGGTTLFAMPNLVKDGGARDLAAHIHSTAEAGLAMDIIEVLHAVSNNVEPPDVDMVRHTCDLCVMCACAALRLLSVENDTCGLLLAYS